MEETLSKAIEDVTLIKKVITRTQHDFSRIAGFFIGVGTIHFLVYTLYGIFGKVINAMQAPSPTIWNLFRGISYLVLLGYVILYLVYHHRIKLLKNELSLSLINIWGILLIGGKIFSILFELINYEMEAIRFMGNTLTFLFPMIGCFVLGMVIQDKWISLISSGLTILYLLLLQITEGITIMTFHGHNMNVGADSIITASMMSVGMILLGIYLKKQRGEK